MVPKKNPYVSPRVNYFENKKNHFVYFSIEIENKGKKRGTKKK